MADALYELHNQFSWHLMAIRLDEIFRVWPAREERIELTGHWHALSAIIATIILLYMATSSVSKARYVNFMDGQSSVSDIALAGVTIFEMKRLFITEAEQQPLVNGLMYAIDFGLGALLVLLAIVMVWRLAIFSKRRVNGLSKRNRTLRGGGGMKNLIPTLILAIFVLTSCKPVDLNAPIPDFDTGIDPDSWVTIPAGEFFFGQHEEIQTTESYEIMVTLVTTSQYADFLNLAVLTGMPKWMQTRWLGITLVMFSGV
jgi:hypothetical protein